MKKSLDPNEYRELRTTIKAIGPVIAGIGLMLIVVGMASFFSSFGGFEPPRYFWAAFVGMPIMFVGVAITKFAYIGSFMRYMAGEVAPVSTDVTNYMVAGTKDSVRDLATAVGEGFAAAGTFESTQRLHCSKCNADNDMSANFCDSCGAPLAKSKPCANCGELNDPDARFCDNCGTKVA